MLVKIVHYETQSKFDFRETLVVAYLFDARNLRVFSGGNKLEQRRSLECPGMYHHVDTLKLTDVSEAIHRTDNEGSTRLYKVGQHQRDYMALHSRRL
jgi:hypothetical protein